MTATDQISELLQLLKSGTDSGALQWDITVPDKAFRLSSKTANVRLTKTEGFDDDEVFQTSRLLLVFNDRGSVIEEFLPETDEEAKQFDELFNSARRSACNTEGVLSKFMEELRTRLKEKPVVSKK